MALVFTVGIFFGACKPVNEEPVKELIHKEVPIEKVDLKMSESFPVQVRADITGYLTNSCSEMDQIGQNRLGTDFFVTVTEVRPKDAMCAQVITPFEKTVDIDVRGLEAGTYVVNVNGEHESFKLEVDNSPTSHLDAATIGFIEGSLGFPSEQIPPMKICAEKIDGGESFCTIKNIEDEKFTYGVGYKIDVPEGKYYVYALNPRNSENKAYYSEYVTCGIEEKCESHEPIPVEVVAGETVSEIDPIDWYAGT